MRHALLWSLGWLFSGVVVAAAPQPLLLPTPDVQAALEQERLETRRPRPVRFAVPHAGLDMPLLTPGPLAGFEPLPDGRLRRTWTLQSAGALNLNFHFAPYRMPPGGELRILNVDGHTVLGPYGPADGPGGVLWTPLLPGEQARIELTLPAAAADGEITLASVQHGFRDLGGKQNGAPAKSGSCNIDVVCPQGDGWRQPIRSVARYTIAGQFVCSGQMLNNTQRDLTPYFLTASHCLNTTTEAQTVVLYWNYETSLCGGSPDGRLDQTSLGAVMAASSGLGTNDGSVTGSDFTLLRLNEVPPLSYQVFYAGWDNRNLAPLGVTGIHHPGGDEKRISFSSRQTEITAYGQTAGTVQSQLTPTHLRVPRWDLGTTEQGSSGSALFNADRRVVGQLSGGLAACDNPEGADWYGRMHSNWFDLQTPTTSLAPWLDPAGTGVATLDGLDPLNLIAPPPPAAAPATRGGGALGLCWLWLLCAAVARRQVSIRYLRSKPRSW